MRPCLIPAIGTAFHDMRTMMRLGALLLALPAAAGCVTPRFEAPAPPVDPATMHAFHNTRTEWVYYSGVVDTAEGRRFGVMFTIFQMTDKLTGGYFYPGILVILDPESKTYHPQYDLGRGRASVTHGVPGADTSVARYAASPDGSMSIQGSFSQNKTPLGVDLVLRPTQGPLLHGVDGIIAMGDGLDSGYYSFTDMVPQGSLSIAGARYTVNGGRVWMDHQWGNWTDDGMYWDWFSLRLHNGSALMLFQFRDKAGRVVPGTWSYRAADQTVRYGQQYILDTRERWTDRESGAVYPLDWRIRIADLQADWTVSPVFNGQVVKPSRLWEGLCVVSGTVLGQAVQGDAFVELTGY
jgi:predicted secreted hydrolase